MTPDVIFFKPSGWVPNNPVLPVLVYHHVTDAARAGAAAFEDRFSANGWRGLWRNGVFSYQHYHTHAHEVLGIAEGRARLIIGGPAGEEMDVRAGDCLILPAGTGHCRISSSSDFLVIGGYPPGQHADIRREGDGPADLAAIAAVPLPSSDPVTGPEGALVRLWREVR